MRAVIHSRNVVPSVCGPITRSVAAWLAGSVLAIFSGSALAHESDDVIVRGGAALVSPHESASPAIVGLSSNAQAGFSGTYMLTDSLGVNAFLVLGSDMTSYGR